MIFTDLTVGDVFSFAGHAGHESFTKTGEHQAQGVNSDRIRNAGGDEQVYLEYAAVDRAARLRKERTHYLDASGWHLKHDTYGGPHDEGEVST